MKSRHSPTSVFIYCPQCGIKDLIQDSEKSIKCNSCGFRYFINMSAAVAAIIRNDKNEILFTVRKHEPAIGMLDLPGGFVDLGETAENAIAREIYEELNLKIIKMEFFRTFTNKYQFGRIQYDTLDLVFDCKVESLQCIQVADDVSGYVFRNPINVKDEEIGLQSIKDIVKQLVIR